MSARKSALITSGVDRQHKEITAPDPDAERLKGCFCHAPAKSRGAWHRRSKKTLEASGHYRKSYFLRFFCSEKRLDQIKTEVDRGTGTS